MIWLQALAVFLLIVLNGALAMAEMAVVSANRTRLKLMADRGSRGARIALALAEDTTSFLSTVQVGITLIGVLAGAVGGATLAEGLGAILDRIPWVAPHGETVAMAFVVMVITLVSIVVGELVPKQLALRDPERLAAVMAPVLRWVLRVARPAVRLLDIGSGLLLRLLGVSGEQDSAITEAEVRAAIHEGARAGVLKELEKEMLSGVMRLADRRAELLMTALEDLVTVDLGQSAEVVWQQLAEAPHTRLVALRDGEVVGVLQTRDALALVLQDRRAAIGEALSHPPRVALDLPATEAMELLRTTAAHMLFVVDAEDAVVGIVTLADIVKAIVGDLAGTRGEAPTVVARADGSWLIDGGALIDLVADRLGLATLPAERSFDSVAGFLLWQFERFPEEGESLQFEGYQFEVIDMDGPRIDKVLVTRVIDPTAPDDELAGG